MDVIMVGPWMLSAERIRPLHVIMVGPLMLSSQNGFDHGRHDDCGMDSAFAQNG